MKKRVIIGLSLLLLAIAAVVHRNHALRDESAGDRAEAPRAQSAGHGPTSAAAAQPAVDAAATNQSAATPKKLKSVHRDPDHPHRLNNSLKSPSELFRSETAILLRNALIETTEAIDDLEIPEHLRSQGDPGSYIIQVRGKSSPAFLQLLTRAGAEIVSYIPHNAYLVTANEHSVNQLRRSPFVQTAVPYEPYYKLDRSLLPVAINQEKLELGKPVRVALFPGTKEEGLRKILDTGAILFQESEFPYGPLITVFPHVNSLVDLAQIPEVQLLETYGKRVQLNELSRVRVGVATNGEAANIHNLTGAGVVVGVNDSGVDRTHPDLAGRVILDDTNHTTTISDGTGHGTHVAGIIASDGSSVPQVFTNGSIAGHNFSGKAPAAQIYPLSVFAATAVPSFQTVGTNTNAIDSVTVTFESAGYVDPPEVFVFDLTPLVTNSAGARVFPGQGAILEAVLTDSRVTSVNVLDGGFNYTPTNTFIVMTTPWSDFQLVTNHARHTNIYTVNNSWGTSLQDYDTTAAIYDAAVRDSMPHWPGEQGINWVFSAGNRGFGTTDGQSGINDSIESPATAKNVITVGATESLRNIPATTNFQTALEETDTDEHVASFSSRGNVGVGLEGDFGRFKPDLVAPGTWILSARASNYHSTNLTSIDATIYNGNTNGGSLRYESGTSQSAPVVSGMLALMEEYFKTHFSLTNSPAMSKALLINGARPSSPSYDYSTRNFQNLQGWGIPALTNTLPANTDFAFLNMVGGSEMGTVVAVEQNGLGTNRIHTGQTHHYQVTVSGTAKDHPVRVTLLWTDPPGNPSAGVKLVNDLDLVVSNTITSNNFIGNFFVSGSDFTEAGELNSTNLNQDVQRDFVNNVENVYMRGAFTNGGSITLDILVHGNRVNVNSTGFDTNDIAQDYVLVVSTALGHEITLEHDPTRDFSTNRLTSRLLNGIPLQEERVGANYPHFPMTLIGSTNQWNFYIFTNQNLPPFIETNTTVTGTQTNTTTNTITPLTNAGRFVAFATFFPPNIGKSRNKEADIDLYVTRGGDPPAAGAPAITNLDISIFTDPKTLLSTNRGGQELVTLDDSSLGEVFYLGVKSEDQQGGEYGLIAISSADGLTQTNADGTLGIPFFPVPLDIPDGAPSSPGGITMFGFGLVSTNIVSAEFTNSMAHEAFGDVTAVLSHNGNDVFLWNHNSDISPGIFSTQRRFFNMVAPNAQGDGPGSFADFFGEDAIGLWTLTVIDDAFTHTGRVVEAGLRIGDDVDDQNRDRMQNGDQTIITFDVDPGESFIDFLLVPFTATNLNVVVQGAPNTDPGIDLLVAYDEIPAAPFFTNTFVTNINGTNFQVTNVNMNTDILFLLAPDTATMSIDVNAGTTPPLTPGFWFARVVNNTSTRQSLTLIFELSHNFALNETRSLESVLDHDLPDYASTNFVIGVPELRTIADLNVLLSIDHPRPSDLVVDLFSPSGTKVLLFENRGDLSRTNLYANFTEDTNLTTSLIDDASMGTMIHLTNLLPVKAVTNLFTNLISPPLFLNSNVLGMAGSHTQPEAIYSPGNSLYACGSLITNSAGSHTNWGLVFNYPAPMHSNNVLTNWLSIWPDPTGGGRVNVGNNTVFKDLVAIPEGVFMVGVSNKDYFPVLPNAQGDSNSVTLDIDTGVTNGGISFAINTLTAEDHYHVYYDGSVLLSEPFPGIGTMGFTNYHLPFGPGNSSFVRLAINQGNSTNPFTLWFLQNLVISNAVSAVPTNQSVIVGYQSSGPVGGGAAGNGAVVLSRGVTNNPYGILGTDRLYGIDYGTETVTNAFGVADSSNYLFVVGSAQYDALGNEKFFLSKVTTAGFPVWTATEEVQASATATVSGGTIASIDVVCGGTNYLVAPTVTIVDLYDVGSGAAAVATIGVNGNVTGITVTSPGTGYLRPAVFISKPALPVTTFPSAGLDVVVVSNTHVFTVGYSNVNAGGATVAPHIRAYDTNGCLLWARNSPSGADGPYRACAAARTNIWAVGAHDAGAGDTASMIERWDMNGNLIASTNYTHLSQTPGMPDDSFNDVIAITCPDRVYAIGTRTNSNNTTDAILVEINSETLEVVSSTVLDSSSGGNDRGMSLTTDGRDLYALVQTTVGGQRFSEVYRFRIRNYYLAEEHLHEFRGEATWFVNGGFVNSNWTLRVTDTRVGGTNATPPQIRCWGLNFTYAASGVAFNLVTTTRGFTGSLLSHTPSYYSFSVPPGVSSVNLNLNSSGPVSAAISGSGLPSLEPGGSSTVLVSNGPGGSFELSDDNGFDLRPGIYYVALQAGLEAPSGEVSLSISFDGEPPPTVIPLLENGILENGNISAGVGFSLYSFEVPESADGARFELSSLSADLNLYLRKGAAPLTGSFDYRSSHASSADETIFVVPDGTSRGLTPGTWVLGVENNTGAPQTFGIKATSLEGGQVYNIVNVESGQPVSGTTTVGNAPNNLYKLVVDTAQRALLFELQNLQGSGDLVVRKGLPPNANVFNARGMSGGVNLPESIPVRTNAQDSALAGDWYFGVINHDQTNVSYTAVAKQPQNGLLLSDTPVQLVSIPSGTSLSTGQSEFGFDLKVIPGETYQVQFAHSPRGAWFILTNIVAPQNAVIEFVHANALQNSHLFYRVQQVNAP